jgi:hypothetical protein
MCRTTGTSSIGVDDSDDADEYADDEFRFPSDEVESLQRRHRALVRPLPTVHRIPTACGIFQNLQLVGVFPTARWLTDPTMPPDVKELFGGTPFFALGEYRVAHLDIQDASGAMHSLTLIVNKGVEGLLTGHWGGVFGRYPPHACWARFETTGEHETTVKEHHKKKPTCPEEAWVFEEFEMLEFREENFQGGKLPGICHSQLERLFGTAVEFLFTLDWNALLHESLVEVRDMSPRLERQRARQRMTPRKLVEEKAFTL